MALKLSELVKDKNKINLLEIWSDWIWLIAAQKDILLITVFGDLFLVGPFNEINWLDSGTGRLSIAANSLNEFQELLKDNEIFANWFMTDIYNALNEQNITLKENEVYSYKLLPSLGGEYSPDNFEPTDLNVHFSLAGQIHKKIKDLPPGTNVNISLEDN